MSVDVYVMPLWRFKAGDFTSPIEDAIGIEPTVISLAAHRPARAPWYLRLLEKLGAIQFTPPPPELSPEECRAAAVKEVDALKTNLAGMIGAPVEWSDNGGIHCNQQFHQPDILRTFACWADHREELPEFAILPERNYLKHPAWTLPEPAERRFPTLVKHSLYTGYLLPVPFEGNYRVEPFKIMDRWEFFRSVASTQTMMREVSDFLEFLATVRDVREIEHGMTLIDVVRWHAEELRHICAFSIEHGLPVIFYG